MSIEAALYAHLTANAGVAALVGSRVYPMGSVPQGAAFPRITYQRISSVHEHHQGGVAGLAHPRLQVDCWAQGASGYAAVKALAEAVRMALDGRRGAMGAGDAAVDVRSVILEGQSDGWEPPTDSSAVGVHRVRMDFIIWHAERVPV